jgi:hypothetical protein
MIGFFRITLFKLFQRRQIGRMTNDKIALISTLPISERPGYSLSICLEKTKSILDRTNKCLKPSFLKRLMGGISKDHARAVVASCNTDLAMVVRVASQIRRVGDTHAMDGTGKAVNFGKALSGYSDRLITNAMEWATKAKSFESAEFGSQSQLLEQSEKFSKLVEFLESPIATLSERETQ